jgi:ADP-heptose:LPS heptosyltransferase
MRYLLTSLLKINNAIVAFFYFLLGYKKIDNFDNIQNILFFKVGSMGDSIVSLPSISSIKDNYPNIDITILTNTGGENLVSIESLIDKSYIKEIINYTGKSKFELLQMLKDKKYGLIVDLTQSSSLLRTIRNMIIFRLLGINAGIGWNISELSFLRKQQDNFNMVGSELEKYLSYFERYNIQVKKRFILGITDSQRNKIDHLLEKNDLKGKRLMAFVVGSKRMTNRWPIEYFDEVIKNVMERTDLTPVLIGGSEDNALVDKLNQKAVSFCGKLTPLESAELFRRCILTLTNDTGPMHLSYAVGTKVIALFNARDFQQKWYPSEELGVVFRDNKIDCRLCYKEYCGHLSCLKNIKSENIINKIKKFKGVV